ncbi:EboA domain-containing protein [Catellatospora bangladeshensis]|uniref:EboA domain-containing protein n=1 Tax=Catellatospora bangladeshensis TaxID=310355 RepID=UPI003608131A
MARRRPRQDRPRPGRDRHAAARRTPGRGPRRRRGRPGAPAARRRARRGRRRRAVPLRRQRREACRAAGLPRSDLVRDALRSNDTRLVAAALGPGARDLPAAEWRQGVLKSVFMGLPLSGVDGLAERADTELGRMLAALRHEREAAGRTMPADAVELLERLH